MKKIVISLFILALFPLLTSAHGSVAQVINNSIVFLSQHPQSVLVGENVKSTFSLKDKEFKVLANIPVKLTVIETFDGDSSLDKQIFTQDYTTDVNGAFSFEYSGFARETYYDVELAFADPVTGEENVTGFLIKPRDVAPMVAEAKKDSRKQIALAAAAGMLLGALILSAVKRKAA